MIIVGNNNKVTRLINLDITALLFLDVLNILQGSGGVCNIIDGEFYF